MAKGGTRGGRRHGPPPARRAPSPKRSQTTKRAETAKHAERSQSAPSAVPPPPSGPFRLGAIPGATPGKWIDAWRARRPNPIELVELAVATQLDPLRAGDVDAALVRLPVDRGGLHVIPLYDELAVVVMAAESHLSVADELSAADLAGEMVIVPRDDVLGMPLPDGAVAAAFDAPGTTADAIEIVATGVGVVVVPMSLARLHHRKDVTHRPLADGPISSVALAWVADRTTEDVEAFVGIVRGRTANSSR